MNLRLPKRSIGSIDGYWHFRIDEKLSRYRQRIDEEVGYKLINGLEEEVFVKHIDIVTANNILIMVHLPHNTNSEAIKRNERLLGKKNHNKKILWQKEDIDWS